MLQMTQVESTLVLLQKILGRNFSTIPAAIQDLYSGLDRIATSATSIDCPRDRQIRPFDQGLRESRRHFPDSPNR